jgi:hypothetical protein
MSQLAQDRFAGEDSRCVPNAVGGKYLCSIATVLGVLTLSSATSYAQDHAKKNVKPRYDVSVSAMGQFGTNTDGNGVHQTETYTGGALASFRQSYKPWLGYQVDYAYHLSADRFNRNNYVQHDTHEATVSYLYKTRRVWDVEPFAYVGGGAVIFVPSNVSLPTQARGAGVYGAGVDYIPGALRKANPRLQAGIRLQYRGLTYRAPNFDDTALSTQSWRTTSEPAAGFFLRW